MVWYSDEGEPGFGVRSSDQMPLFVVCRVVAD